MNKRITYALLFAAVVFTLCTASFCDPNDPLTYAPANNVAHPV